MLDVIKETATLALLFPLLSQTHNATKSPGWNRTQTAAVRTQPSYIGRTLCQVSYWAAHSFDFDIITKELLHFQLVAFRQVGNVTLQRMETQFQCSLASHKCLMYLFIAISWDAVLIATIKNI